MAVNDVINVRTLCHINDDIAKCTMTAKTETIRPGVEKVKISANPDNLYYQNLPCDLTKKMNTHTLCFCPLIRKLQAFEILKWAQVNQWRKQRTSSFTREIQLIFSLQWKYSFFYIFTAVKYSFFKICIIFNQYFLYFNSFVYNKSIYLRTEIMNCQENLPTELPVREISSGFEGQFVPKST